MAILQISQIQIRRGLQQDLPQLASAELGWSLDTRRLFIGNGTLAEGAPSTGVTEILTQYSNFLGFINAYTFAGTNSGYTSQTGTTALNPVTRSLQSVLDDTVTVYDFGAVGNGVADDTAALQRAITQIYPSTLNNTYSKVQRTIKIPAGNYLISSALLIPPNCTLKGDGKNNTIINIGNSANSAIITSDSLFQYGGSLGAGGAVYPGFITIQDIGFKSNSTSYAVATIASVTDILFDRVQFKGGNYSLNITGNSSIVKLHDSTFTGFTLSALSIASTVTGLVSRNDRLDTYQYSLSTGTTNITTLANGAGYINYQLQDSLNNYRFGKISYSVSNGVCAFEDEYTEPASSLGANVYANSTGTLSCTVTNSTTFKYSTSQFT